MRMVHAVMRALTTIRSELPPDALDCQLHLSPLPSQTPNCQMDFQLLPDNYAAPSAISNVISYDVLKDPSCVRSAVADLLIRSKKAKYIKMSKEEMRAALDSLPINGTIDAYQAAEILMGHLLADARIDEELC